MNDGGVQCWGDNAEAKLGDGSTNESSNPVAVQNLTNVTSVSAGHGHTCAQTVPSATTQCWGDNRKGQLAHETTGTSSSAPIDVCETATGPGCSGGNALLDIHLITAGASFSCALVGVVDVKCWGFNSAGQVGDGTTTDAPYPVDVSGLTAKAIDSDTDGCSDKAEQQTTAGSEMTGGRRDHLNPWDFYDTNGDRQIDLVNDITNVALLFGADADNDPPGEPDGYDPALDRSAPPPGGDPWDMQAPDGVIDLVNDIFGVAFQFGHNCS